VFVPEYDALLDSFPEITSAGAVASGPAGPSENAGVRRRGDGLDVVGVNLSVPRLPTPGLRDTLSARNRRELRQIDPDCGGPSHTHSDTAPHDFLTIPHGTSVAPGY